MSPFRIGRRGALHAGLGLLGPPLLTACGGALRAVTNEAQPRQATAAPAAWALVLSGGGLRGFAHLGVLRGLRSLGLAPPLTVGSSVGAVIGGLYASGAALEGAESMVMSPELDPWGSLLTSPESRSAALDALLRATLGKRRLEDFPRRFVAVATARDSAHARAFGHGDAACAILASAALPGALAPVVIGGQEFVDGGLSQPLPVRMARQLGAARVVAVDVGFHPEVPAPTGRINSVLHAGFLMARNLSAPDRAAADLLIEPRLPPVPEISLARRAALIDCGERAALALAESLHALAATPQAVVARRR